MNWCSFLTYTTVTAHLTLAGSEPIRLGDPADPVRPPLPNLRPDPGAQRRHAGQPGPHLLRPGDVLRESGRRPPAVLADAHGAPSHRHRSRPLVHAAQEDGLRDHRQRGHRRQRGHAALFSQDTGDYQRLRERRSGLREFSRALRCIRSVTRNILYNSGQSNLARSGQVFIL